MIIDEKVRIAIGLLFEDCDFNQSRLAEKLKIGRSYANKLINGNGKYFSEKTWSRIEPILAPYLKKIAEDKYPPLNSEDQAILNFFRDPENKLERYELLARIERAKKTKGNACPGEPQTNVA